MLIKDNRLFLWGIGLTLSFLAVLIYMFTPNFGDNRNAFEASDQMFNSISKGSINYIPGLTKRTETFNNSPLADVTLKLDDNTKKAIKDILNINKIEAFVTEKGLKIDSSLGEISRAALKDSASMFNNKGVDLSSRYGISEKEVMYVWWSFLRGLDLHLKMEKRFKEASFTSEVVIKGVEVGYNYYGIEPQNAKGQAGLLTFALIFYVLYTVWWGYAIFFLFEGFGLAMTAGSKKEI